MSSEEFFHISNRNGHVVAVPLEAAKELFGILNMNDFFNTAKQDKEPGDEEEMDQASHSSTEDDAEQGPLKTENLEYANKVLDVVRDYAMLPASDRTSEISRPLAMPLSHCVKPGEMELVREAESQDYLVELLNCAMFLRFRQLTSLCAAYMAVRIDEIAKEAPDIMTGAERIRNFMHMENEWTEEEMGHLRAEMEYAKQVDPHVY
jgi:hypothetical protein